MTPADESAPLLDNPLRNGLLLCDLAGQFKSVLHLPYCSNAHITLSLLQKVCFISLHRIARVVLDCVELLSAEVLCEHGASGFV